MYYLVVFKLCILFWREESRKFKKGKRRRGGRLFLKYLREGDEEEKLFLGEKR